MARLMMEAIQDGKRKRVSNLSIIKITALLTLKSFYVMNFLLEKDLKKVCFGDVKLSRFKKIEIF